MTKKKLPQSEAASFVGVPCMALNLVVQVHYEGSG